MTQLNYQSSNYQQLHPYMPSDTFGMLMGAPSGGGKTNTLMRMMYKLLFSDKIYLFSKKIEQPKYQKLLEIFEPISEECGYDIVEVSNDEIIPVGELDDDNQKQVICSGHKRVIFDDFVCEKKKKRTYHRIFY